MPLKLGQRASFVDPTRALSMRSDDGKATSVRQHQHLTSPAVVRRATKDRINTIRISQCSGSKKQACRGAVLAARTVASGADDLKAPVA